MSPQRPLSMVEANHTYVEAAQGLPVSTLADRLSIARDRLKVARFGKPIGWVQGSRGSLILARLGRARIGDLCGIVTPEGTRNAQIIGFSDGSAMLSPFGGIDGIPHGALIIPLSSGIKIPVGHEMRGRVVDSLGKPIDGRQAMTKTQLADVWGRKVSAMERPLIEEPLATGIRAVDGALTLGRGQRMGIFGPAGVGKSNLLAALTRGAKCDTVVVALVGERAREVREFLDRHLPAEERKKVVCVVATSDQPPMERLYTAHTACRIAEFFRDEGQDVLLLLDSVTRVARAMREIGLAAGEPPTRHGFPASVFELLPRIIERAGRTEEGSITALYTVLTEADIDADPIAEELRSLTDGHIILSRDLAENGHYPAIDIAASISRLMNDIVSDPHKAAASGMRRKMSLFREVEMLIQIGEYEHGKFAEIDDAVDRNEPIVDFLRQSSDDRSGWDETLDALAAAVG